MPDTIERPEYEARHLELQRQITDMKVQLSRIETEVVRNKIGMLNYLIVILINFTFTGGLWGILAITGHIH